MTGVDLSHLLMGTMTMSMLCLFIWINALYECMFVHLRLHVCIFVCTCMNVYVWVFFVLFVSFTHVCMFLTSSSCIWCVFAGILPAVWRGQFLPAGSSAGRAGALEDWAGMRGCVSRVWVCRDSCGSGARWKDQRECPPGRDRGGFSWDQRCRVHFLECQPEPGLHTRHSLPAQWLLPPQLRPGTKHTLDPDFKPFKTSVCKG